MRRGRQDPELRQTSTALRGKQLVQLSIRADSPSVSLSNARVHDVEPPAQFRVPCIVARFVVRQHPPHAEQDAHQNARTGQEDDRIYGVIAHSAPRACRRCERSSNTDPPMMETATTAPVASTVSRSATVMPISLP